ncbi:3'-5' exonuclease, partial [Klebsiella pneumoniae]|nr:3'-5' exonuclease [Klebsiella pneumoniae]
SNSSNLPLESLEVVVMDLETTSFQAFRGDEIISIGAVAMRGAEILEQEDFFSYINPQRKVPDHIQRLTGITGNTLDVAPDLITTLSRFFR